MRVPAHKRRVINCLLFSLPALGQGFPAVEQSFEVASVKPNPPRVAYEAGRPNCATGKFTAQTSLQLTIAWAYGVNIIQLDGTDKWPAAHASFAMEGVPAGPADEAQCRRMVQALLAERFKLAIHRESRPMSVYALVVARNGPKFQPAGEADQGRTRPVACKSPSRGWSMQDLADCMDLYLYPTLVVDHTGLSGGLYKITLDFSPPNGVGGLLGDGPDAFSAVESQLGLKLEDRKQQVEVIVIDHLEQPEAN